MAGAQQGQEVEAPVVGASLIVASRRPWASGTFWHTPVMTSQ